MANQRPVTDQAPKPVATNEQIQAAPAGMPREAMLGAGIIQPASKPGSSVINGVDYSKSGAVQAPIPATTGTFVGKGGSFGGAGATGTWGDFKVDVSKLSTTDQTEIAKQQQAGVFDVKKLSFSAQQAYSFQKDKEDLEVASRMNGAGADTKTASTLNNIVSNRGIYKAEDADNRTMAREISAISNKDEVAELMYEKASKVLAPDGSIKPDVKVAKGPAGGMGEKTLTANIEKSKELGTTANEKATDIMDKVSSGGRVSDKDWSTFQATLRAYNGSYDKALKNMEPEVARAIAAANVASVMSMDSVRLQAGGMTSMSDRKAAQEVLENNLKLGKMQLQARATGDDNFSNMLKIYSEKQDAYIKEYDLASKGGTRTPAETYLADPTLIVKNNALSMFSGMLMATQFGIAEDPPILSLEKSGMWSWLPWSKPNKVVTTPFSQTQGQSDSNKNRQAATSGSSRVDAYSDKIR